jgi:pSer/pThr/pTyr-binding forkhead associated (FHA) protein
MTDPRFQSIHLEGQPRRELFRQARSQLEAACGSLTLAGDLHLLSAGDPGDGDTMTAPPIVPGGPTHLWIKDGDTLHPLGLGVNSVGRLPDNSVVIRDEHVSRRHCAVVVHSDGRCEVHDIASKNGTILNGKRINGPTRIRAGDQLLLCSRKLTLVADDRTPLPPPPDRS